MTLIKAYQTFLASPSPDVLVSDAAINYVTTLTTVTGPDAIMKHFVREAKLLKRQREDVLHVIESSNALCVEIETTIKFEQGGGQYLPGLDDNFLADQVVTLPMIHIVQFDANQKIQQVRISWDQGSLLKMVETIGARGKNWPLKDGKDHTRLIRKSASSAPISEVSKQMADVTITSRPHNNSNPMRDPKASLDLFAPRDVDDVPEPEQVKAPRAPASAAPTDRDYGELFVSQSEPAERASSPNKGRGKAGAGKSFRESRILSPEDADLHGMSPSKPRNEKKYQHFEFSDGTGLPEAEQRVAPGPSKRSNRTNHASQWGFEDFVTPSKPGSRGRVQDQRTFEFGETDEEQSPPTRRPAIHQARSDQQSQFEIEDDGGPQNKARGHPRGFGSMNKDAALYKNLYDENGVPATPAGPNRNLANVKDRQNDFDAHWRMTDEATPRAGDDIQSDPRAALQKPMSTVVDNKGRSKDFAPHFEIKDDGPILSEQTGNRPSTNTHAKAVSTMQANWEATDVSPAGPRTAPGGKENRNVARRGAAQPNWGFGDDEAVGPKKIYKTAGNGMGSRTGARGWGIGDESGGEEEAPVYHGRQRATQNADQWDF